MALDFLNYNIKIISFSEILVPWSQNLWPNRQSPIEPVSAIDLSGGYNLDLMAAKPVFWGAFTEDQSEVIGVVSGFKTSTTYFRSRGIWVSPHHRRKGVGAQLIKAVEAQAQEESCPYIWSMPRQISWPFYKMNGFEIINSVDKFEFGPHYIAVKELKKTPLQKE